MGVALSLIFCFFSKAFFVLLGSMHLKLKLLISIAYNVGQNEVMQLRVLEYAKDLHDIIMAHEL